MAEHPLQHCTALNAVRSTDCGRRSDNGQRNVDTSVGNSRAART